MPHLRHGVARRRHLVQLGSARCVVKSNIPKACSICADIAYRFPGSPNPKGESVRVMAEHKGSGLVELLKTAVDSCVPMFRAYARASVGCC